MSERNDAAGYLGWFFLGAALGAVTALLLTPRTGAETRGLLADLHVVLPYGWNDHHKVEAIFKAVGKSFKLAASRDGRYRGLVPSTKGMLE